MIDLSSRDCPVANDYLSASADSDGEGRLLTPLLEWASRTGRVRQGTRIAVEVPFNGRRIDLVTFSRSGRVTAYELKLGNVDRVLEQAWYNRRRFSRSYAVLAHTPNDRYLELAADLEIGVIAITDGRAREVVPSPYRRPDRAAAARVMDQLNRTGTRRGRRV